MTHATTRAGADDPLGGFVDRLVHRTPVERCAPGKLPWDDPEFSARMLREHLDQTHDHASRKGATIDAHVEWIFDTVLTSVPGDVLDLGCGPGLYTARLAERGCRCVGLDISPASVDHARRTVAGSDLDCSFVLGDVRTADLGKGHDLAMLLFGEFNTFTRGDAAHLLVRIAACLRPGGTLLLEAHTFDSVAAEGARSAGWYTASEGLFAERPHLVLSEHAWDDSSATASTRFEVVDDTGAVAEYTEALHAYSTDDYVRALADAGFEHPTVTADVGAFTDPAMVIVTARAPQPAG